MKDYQEPMLTVIRFDMSDRITWEEAGEDLPSPTYSETVEMWD